MNFVCKKCKADQSAKTFVPFKNPAYKTLRDPKWSFHIGVYCLNCGTHNGFAEQTPELMDELSGNAFINLDLKKIKNDRIGEIQSDLPFESWNTPLLSYQLVKNAGRKYYPD